MEEKNTLLSIRDLAVEYRTEDGVVKAVNEELLDNPALVNEDPYGAWLIQVEQMTDEEELLDAAAYEAHCAAEEG